DRHHRSFPSIPTRRSSDLDPAARRRWRRHLRAADCVRGGPQRPLRPGTDRQRPVRRQPGRPGPLRLPGRPDPGWRRPGEGHRSASEINHHWTKAMTASADGRYLYVGIGSNSNITERGMEAEVDRAMVWQIDVETGHYKPYATGLRNPTALAIQPGSGR